jgi:glycerol-3-phosphate acyltransferase PlsY
MDAIIDHVGMYGLIGLVVGYFIGSIPSGLLLSKAAGLGDIRAIGSGNIGATNVLRTGNKKIAAATLVCDLLKGTIAVLIGWAIAPQMAFGAAWGVVLGHNFPIWLKFKGGKGVATTVGVLFGLSFKIGLMTALTWIGIAYFSKLSSLAALVAIGLAPFFAIITEDMGLFYLIVPLTALCWLRHHANIKRLMANEEPKIDLNSKAKA